MFEEKFRTMQCPHCMELINTSMSQCRFCNHAIDAVSAEKAADAHSKLTQACSDANYLKIVGLAMPAFYGLSWAPFFGMIGWFAFLFIFFAIPVMAIRWWFKFRSVRTSDPDFKSAKRSVVEAITIWIGMSIFSQILPLLIGLFSG